MAHANYDTGLASSCYINLAHDGSVEAGMILENGEVLTVTLAVGQNRSESIRNTAVDGFTHKLVLERDGESIIRKSSYFGLDPAVVEEFLPSMPRGKDYWLGGLRRR